MKPTIVALALLAAAAGCSKNEAAESGNSDNKPSVTAHEADNTGRNERDKRADSPTPGMQGENDWT